MAQTLRNLVIILGDQLDRQSLVFDDFDPEQVITVDGGFSAVRPYVKSA